MGELQVGFEAAAGQLLQEKLIKLEDAGGVVDLDGDADGLLLALLLLEPDTEGLDPWVASGPVPGVGDPLTQRIDDCRPGNGKSRQTTGI